MAYQPLERLLPRADHSIYKLVRMASLRASELADGKPRLVECSGIEKLATVALEEILSGKVVLKVVADTQLDTTPPPPKKTSSEDGVKETVEQT